MTLTLEIRRALTALADPARAASMQRYMKSEMPFLGVAMPIFRKTVRPILKAHPVERFEAWRDDALALWHGAKYREERYAVVELMKDRRARPFHTMQALPLVEELIVTGAWWDTVDAFAADDLGLILKAEPKPMKKAMLSWARSDDLWKRRSAILCQLRFKENTDLDLLYRTITPALDSKEFFLRKAIGWALRQYAWTDPKEVKRWVKEHESELSGLSRREALKNL
ncbi:MAG: DNA alkylation repair protein [Myxococcota bacterium]